MTVFEIVILVVLYMIMYGFALENLRKNARDINRSGLILGDYLFCLLSAFLIPVTFGMALRSYLSK